MSLMFLSLTENVGGAEKSLISLLNNLDGFDYVVIPSGRGQFTDLLDVNKLKYKVVPFSFLLTNISKATSKIFGVLCLIIFSLSLTIFLKRNSIKTIYLNNYKSFFVGYILSYLHNANFVFHIRDGFLGTKIERIVLKRMNAVNAKFIANSKFSKDRVISTYPVDNISVVYNGIEIVSLDDSSFIFDESKNINIGIFSRLSKVKGQDVFLKSLLHLTKTNIVIHLFGDVVHGEEGYLKYLQEIADNLSSKLSINVIFYGFVQNPIEYMKKMQVIILPTVEPEPFGRVIIEAQMLQKVIVATAIGGPLEIIENNINGILVDPEINNYSYFIDDIATNFYKYNDMMKKARTSVINRFSVDAMVSQIIKNLG